MAGEKLGDKNTVLYCRHQNKGVGILPYCPWQWNGPYAPWGVEWWGEWTRGEPRWVVPMERLNLISHRQGDPLANRTINNRLLPSFVRKNVSHSNKTRLLAEGILTSDLWVRRNQLLQPSGLNNFLFPVKFPAVPQLRKKGMGPFTLSSRHTPQPTAGVFQILSAS